MDRCALFVDAGYALADGAMAVHGTRRRDSVSWDHAGLLKLLAGLARDRTGLPVLRCYWYETADGRTSEHDALAEMPGLKLRLVNGGSGQAKGIESQVRRDLVTLAKSGAISDAFIASANDHLAELVSEVQDLGLRVVVLHIDSETGWTIPQPLRQECDDIVEVSGVHLRPFVDLIRGAEPSLPRRHERSVTDSDESLAASAHALPSRTELPAQPVPVAAGAHQLAEPASVNGSGSAPHHAAHAADVQPGNPYGPWLGERAAEGVGSAAGGSAAVAGSGAAHAAAQPNGAGPAGARHAGDSGQFPAVRNGARPAGAGHAGDSGQFPAVADGAAQSSAVRPGTGQFAVLPPSAAGGGQAGPAANGHGNSYDRGANGSTGNGSIVGSTANGGAPNGAGNGTSADGSAAGPRSSAASGMSGAYNRPGDDGRAAKPPFATGPQQVVPAPYGATSNHQAPVDHRPPSGPASYQVPALPGDLAAGAAQGRVQGGPGLNGGSSYPQDAARNGATRNGAGPVASGRDGSAPRVGPHQGSQGSQANGAAAGHSANGGLGMPRPGSGQNGGIPNGSSANGGAPNERIASRTVPDVLSNGGVHNGNVPNGGVPNGGRPAGPAGPAAGLVSGNFATVPVAGPAQTGTPSSHAGPAPGQPAARPPAGPGQPPSAHQPQPMYPAGPSYGGGQLPPGREQPNPALQPRGTGPAHSQHPAQQHQRNPYQQQNHYQPQPPSAVPEVRPAQPVAVPLADAVQAAHNEGFTFGESVGREAPGLWLEAVLARKPRMPSDLEARLLQGSILPIDSLLHDEVRHSLRRGFWDALESARR